MAPFFGSLVAATDYRVSPYDWQGSIREELFEDDSSCDGSRKSVMALAVTCALLLVIYVCTVFCLCTKNKLASDKSDKIRSIDGAARNYISSATYLR